MHTPILSDYLLQHFDRQSALPGNRQLYRLLRKAILTRVLAPDTKLPSTRDLAAELLICRNTILYAYQQLLAEGYVEGRSGSGTFVSSVLPAALSTPGRSAFGKPADPPAAAALSRRGHQLIDHAAAVRQQWGAFVPGVPDVTQFPHQIWNRLQNKVWRKPAPDTLAFAQGGGHLPLREALTDHLKITRSVDCSAEQIVITGGVHQSIDLCLRLLSDPGDLAWIEDPGYWGASTLLRASGLALRPIALDAEGMCPSAEDMAHVPRFIFLTPSHQYPLGMAMSPARRRMLLEYAKQHGCWIIEDDYDCEFQYGGRSLPSLQGMESAGRVLYMGSFSQTLFPELRLGYMVLPPALVQPFISGVDELHHAGNVLTQAILAEFIIQGFFTAHIRRMRCLYATRLALLQEAIRSRFGRGTISVAGSDGGLHLVLQLPPYCDDQAIAQAAAQAGIGVRPLSFYHHGALHRPPGLLLGYGCVHEAKIAAAFEVLAAVIERHLSPNPATAPQRQIPESQLEMEVVL